MITVYIILLVCIAALLFSSYHAMVNGYIWGAWLTGTSLFVIFAILIGLAMFK